MTTQNNSRRWVLLVALALLCWTGRTAQAQTASPSPLVRSTSMNTAVAAPGFEAAPDDITPVIPLDIVPSTQGALFETPDGRVIFGQAVDQGFNPASAIKAATTYATLNKFGPEHRFNLTVWTNGPFDNLTGTITGDLIVSGRDPSFNYEHAILVARDLNKQGIRTVTGDLVVSNEFTLSFDASAERSGNTLYDTLDVARRPARAKTSWKNYQTVMGDTVQDNPSVSVLGAVYVDNVPLNARKLTEHRSSKLVDIVKVMMCYSNNFLAEELGETVGGPVGLRNFLIRDAGLRPEEVSLASTSGLGVNRMTPRSMMKTLRGLRKELTKRRLGFSDIMPVAGIDPGTLSRRYANVAGRGSVIGKTGTLPRTDNGASALIGQLNTPQGEVYFVIFNMRGSVPKFRASQDALLASVQNMYGGPVAFNYRPAPLQQRLLQTETEATTNADELDPNQN